MSTNIYRDIHTSITYTLGDLKALQEAKEINLNEMTFTAERVEAEIVLTYTNVYDDDEVTHTFNPADVNADINWVELSPSNVDVKWGCFLRVDGQEIGELPEHLELDGFDHKWPETLEIELESYEEEIDIFSEMASQSNYYEYSGLEEIAGDMDGEEETKNEE